MSGNEIQTPPHFMVLDALSRGIKSVDKILRVTKLDKAQVQSIASDLVFQRLVLRREKKAFFGDKKEQLEINDTGQRLLDAKKADLEKQAIQMRRWYANGNTEELHNYVDSNRTWIPVMIFSGIINMMFFASMMSMMDMALNPAETAFAGYEGLTGADYGSTSPDGGNAGDFSGGDIGGGDISF